jgi:ribosomal protein S18 acetylase RimI-like enzyme
VIIRDATPAELTEVGELRVAAYRAGGHLTDTSEYAQFLRELGGNDDGEVLIAVSQAGDGQGQILGTVTLQLWPRAGQIVDSPGQGEIRALAVQPRAQGAGIGSALVTAVIERARQCAVTHLLLCTEPEMRAAHRLYERAGFTRLPERDWSPSPRIKLLVYELWLNPEASLS